MAELPAACHVVGGTRSWLPSHGSLPHPAPGMGHRPCARARLVSIPSRRMVLGHVLLPSWASVSPLMDIKLLAGSCSTPQPRPAPSTMRYGLTLLAPLLTQHGSAWKQQTSAQAAGDTSAPQARQERGSLPWAGQEGARRALGSQLGKRECLDPRAAQPAASPATPSANLAALSSPHCRTSSGPHSILHSRAAPRQLGSFAPTVPKSTQRGGEGHP